ncbi:lysoplasmalogenase [Microterricola viridarii]|uniref:Uncharacterized membrane protein YhhN n=1 Tax=Microterricola viridarii TaxID=412690 RepID=A0A1H1X9B4_9MICO|nr:lysoplasmalogenase [Microterricola viridarii]SDT05239.1 Uncharacterized membrane protein YhhN [Microterricola viridarii]
MTSMSPSNTHAFAPAVTSLLKPLPAFAPFLVLSALHLVFQFLHLGAAANFSKWLLMPALVLAVIAATPARRSTATALLLAAITLSWLGDITPLYANDFFFVLGLSFFLLAHVAYLLLFVRGLGYARPRAWALVYLLWWLAFVALLGPSLGSLLIPVALYGLVLGAMAAAASRGTLAIACGGALFLVSDTLLGSNKFLATLDLWQSGFLIMVTYLAGQGLIAWGVVSVQRRAAAGSATEALPAARG